MTDFEGSTHLKTQESTMQEAAHQQPLIKRLFRGCKRFLGTFLFIMFMTRNLLDSMGVNTLAPKQLTYLAILSCFICVTIGASYWFGDRVIQWRSYCVSSIIAFLLYFAFLVDLVSHTNYHATLLQFVVIPSLPIVSTVYSIRKLRQIKKIQQERAVSNTKRQSSKRGVALANTIRVIALISFSSVFLENAQHILLRIFAPESRVSRMFPYSEAIDAIVAGYAVWLLICFARKEFVKLGGQSEKGAHI
jgi:hypothetical protein